MLAELVAEAKDALAKSPAPTTAKPEPKRGPFELPQA